MAQKTKSPVSTETALKVISPSGIHSVSHGQAVFKADKQGVIRLPVGESWYSDLLASGDLIVTPADTAPDEEPVNEPQPNGQVEE